MSGKVGTPYPVKSHEKAVKLSSCIRRSAGAPGIKNLECRSGNELSEICIVLCVEKDRMINCLYSRKNRNSGHSCQCAMREDTYRRHGTEIGSFR